MTMSKGGSSRRSASVARDIARRRRNKQLKHDGHMSVRKQKKHIRHLHDSAPDGYSFLPHGTGELATRCNELAAERQLKIYKVNDDPVSEEARNPLRVSYYLRRIGFYVPKQVLEDACRELDYVYYDGQYMTRADSIVRRDYRIMKRAMAARGLDFEYPVDQAQETDEQIRAAITELFPKIPDEDRNEIVQRAWVEGNVGTNSDLSLARRVQLATVSRIRHAYTDYDPLLRAFGDRPYARTIVEQECMKKLSEWRGEHDEDDLHNELQKIVHQVIVIDSDSEDDADDEDSSSFGDGYVSDSSLDANFRSTILQRPSPGRPLPQGSSHHRPQSLDMRRPANIAGSPLRPQSGYVARSAVSINRSDDDLVIIDGRLYRKESVSTASQMPNATFPNHRLGLQPGPQPPHREQVPYTLYPPLQTVSERSNLSGRTGVADVLDERPIASIEPNEDFKNRATSTIAHPDIPAHFRYVEHQPQSSGARSRYLEAPPPLPSSLPAPVQRPHVERPSHREIIGLTAPNSQPQTLHHDFRPRHMAGYLEDHSSHIYRQPAGNVVIRSDDRPQDRFEAPTAPPIEPYDPTRPALDDGARYLRHHNTSFRTGSDRNDRSSLIHAQIAPVQYISLQPGGVVPSNTVHLQPSRLVQESLQPRQEMRQPQQVIYVTPSGARYAAQPIHGAPAPVQRISMGPEHSTPAGPEAVLHPAPSQVPLTPYGGHVPQPQYKHPR